jgi:hypothetical protein
MACQIMEWLIAGAGPTAFQHALVGAGCLLTFDLVRRWRAKGRVEVSRGKHQKNDDVSRRRAA